MSRIGKRLIPLPQRVTLEIQGQDLTVKGPKGTLKRTIPNTISVEQEGTIIKVQRENESRSTRQLHGLSRTLLANMIEGVANGFKTRLEIIGTGYRAEAQGNKLTLKVGYSHPIEIVMPEGLQVVVEEKNTQVVISGIDKELVGNMAAKIRAVRPPEVYKGKGIRYSGEFVRRKQGKTGGKGKGGKGGKK